MAISWPFSFNCCQVASVLTLYFGMKSSTLYFVLVFLPRAFIMFVDAFMVVAHIKAVRLSSSVRWYSSFLLCCSANSCNSVSVRSQNSASFSFKFTLANDHTFSKDIGSPGFFSFFLLVRSPSWLLLCCHLRWSFRLWSCYLVLHL